MQSSAMTDGNASQAPVPARTSFLGRARNYFFTGIVIIAPVVITIWATIWFISFFDSWVKPLIPFSYNPDNYLPFTVPGTGLVVAVLIITTVGALGANLVGRTMLGWWDRVVQRTPVVRSIYKASKQIFETLFSQKGTNFKYVCLVEWPHQNMWTIAFVSREIDGAQIGLEAGRRMYAVYVSTTPNPTGGYVVFADEGDVQILDMSVEDGLKLVISMGLVMPEKRMSSSLELKGASPARPRRKTTPRRAT
jgi:uncharacterized membrane protein